MKRRSFQIKIEILNRLFTEKELSLTKLERKIDTSWKTITDNISELEFFELIKFENKKAQISQKGIYFLKKSKKRQN